MQYYILAFLFLLSLAFFYKVMRKVAEPNFRLETASNSDKLSFMISSLATNRKKCFARGANLSVKLIKKYIVRAYKIITQKVKNKEEILPFENYIYDNFYIFNKEINFLKLSKSLLYNLPNIASLPRAYELIALVIKSNEGFIDANLLEFACNAFSSQTPLNFYEICAVKYLVKYCLLEYIAIFCAKATVINKMLFKGKSDAINNKIDFNSINFNSYAYGFCEVASSPIKQEFEQLCINNDIDVTSKINNFFKMVSKYNGLLSCAVKSLFSVDEWCGDEYILNLSPIADYFYTDKNNDFALLTVESKFLYCYNIAKLATKKKTSENAIVREVLYKSETDHCNIAKYILPKPKNSKFMFLLVASYFVIACMFAVICGIIIKKYLWLYIPLLMPILTALSVMFINSLLKNVVKSRRLPAYDLQFINGINAKTLITVPTLVASEEDARQATSHLQTIISSNPNSIFNYCLLIDFVKSTNFSGEKSDANLMQILTQLHNEIPQKDRVCVLVRKRQKINGQEKYQGWEKKRGALIQLNKYILNDENNFMLKLGSINKSVKYVITLDSDTLINSCEKLVEIMEHPYNNNKTIVSINMRSSSQSASKTYFSKLFCGGWGFDNYSDYLRNLECDIFSCGNYTGKGIYRVKEFDQQLSMAFGENKILSHDFLEGAWSGCSDSDVYALDVFPKSYSQFLTRELRWLRGDWQLLPFVFPYVKDAQGQSVKNKLSLISKWHIFCNMFFSLLPIVSLILVLTSFWATNPVIIILLAFSVYIFRAALSLRFLIFDFRQSVSEIFRQFFAIAVIPTLAISYMYAISITLWRLINKKNLLEWQVFAHSDSEASFIPNAVVAIIVVSTTLVFGLGWGYFVIGLIFLSGILINHILGLCREKKVVQNQDLDAILLETAKRTLEYFNICATEEFNYLPCDNFQEYLNVGFAKRTSPTNIGMYLMAYISAYELKLIDKAILTTKIENTITTVEKLEKWKGNLFNWVDVTTLKTLYPKYVSTVDSGNFLACLMATSAYTEGALNLRINNLIHCVDITALLDNKRGLFYIGYNFDTGSYDSNHYDLMGSESALTYLVAVGLGKAQKSVWENLCRENVRYKGNALYSWTGGMFEYLMSRLFFKFSDGTLMQSSNISVVKSQIYYAKKRKSSCYGISECQNSILDDNGSYQYKAYGVPQLAYSNIADSDFIAPYASFLAISYNSMSVLQNTHIMENIGALGKFGFYESFNCKTFDVQKAYMTHHQGMLLVAIANYKTEDSITKKLQELPAFRAASLLLDENIFSKAKHKIMAGKPLNYVNTSVIKCSKNTTIPCVNLLSNDKYKLITTSFGGGYSCYNNKIITEFDYDGNGCSIFAIINKLKYKLNIGDFSAESWFTSFTQTNQVFSTECKTQVLSFLDGDVTHVKFTNLARKENITFRSVATLALNGISEHMSHPLYSKMFIETGLDADKNFMWAKRVGEDGFFVAHFLLPSGEASVVYEGNRSNLFDRIKNKQISFGRVLEPVFSASINVNLATNESVEFDVVNLVAYDYKKLKSMVKLCGSAGFFTRQEGASEAMSKMLNIASNTKMIASKLMYGSFSSINVDNIDGINMRRPIITIDIKGENQIDFLKTQLNQLKKLYEFGISFNLVVLYSEKHNYYLHLTDLIHSCVEQSGIATRLNYGSVFKIINSQQDENLANVIRKNSIDISKLEIENIPKKNTVFNIVPKKNASMEFYSLQKVMGIGGYTQCGDYCIDLTNVDTPAPWSNIISDSNFGTLITESGGGYTFGANAREVKLTKWSNDPLEDFPSESIILSEKNLEWSVTKKPIKTQSKYFCLHSLGYTEFKNNYNGILSLQKEYIAVGYDTKIYEITLENHSGITRQISVTLALNLVLGDFKLNTIASSHIQKINDYRYSATNSVSGVNSYINCDRKLTLQNSNSFFSARAMIELKPKKTERIIFSLGEESEIDLSKYELYFSECVSYFQSVSKIEICSENNLKYLLKWLPYQVLSSRFNARTGFYQSSGAYGFRDQLQDCLTLLYVNPQLVKEHILECAMHQFERGDVQHWWHSPNIGVRTKICDDRLFLPYLVAEYIEFTHDYQIIAERVSFLENVKITAKDVSVYSSPANTSSKASLLEHCLRAIDSSCEFGADGLMLMQGGDWNDAMDKVGEKGNGTSVWCSMFLYFVIEKFLPLVNDKEVRSRYNTAQDLLYKAVDNSWENDRFARAYTDDGKVLGAERSEECKIDLLCQAWATISECAKDNKKKVALNTAADMLVDRKNKLIKLLYPAFKNMKNIGYISSYPSGVRENGGQYTHAAVWFIISCFKAGKINEAYELLTMINPIEHTLDESGVNKYFVEPYVVAADVYSGDFAGRGGWSWYTGSASWLYKCIVEYLLGIKFSGNTIKISPNLPNSIPKMDIKIKTKYGALNICIDNTVNHGDWRLKVGQVTYNTNSFTLSSALVGKDITISKLR